MGGNIKAALCAATLACALLLGGSGNASAAPTLSDSTVRFGTDYSKVTCQTITVTGEPVSFIQSDKQALWLNGAMDVDSGVLTLCVNVCLVPTSGDRVLLDINGAILTVAAKTSTSTDRSACGPATDPTSTVPRSTGTPRPTSTTARTQGAVTATPEPASTPVVDCNANPTDPVRPSRRDVSVKIENSGRTGDPYGFDADGCTATQVWMDAAQESRWNFAAEAVRMMRDTLPGSAHRVQRDVELLGDITKRLGVIYEIARALKDTLGGSWQTDEDGKHYDKEAQVLYDVAGICLAYPVECAQSPKMNDSLADVMDVRIVRDASGTPLVVEAGALFDLPSNELRNRPRMTLGTVQARTQMPALTEAQLIAVDAAHEAHHAVDDFACGVGPAQPAGIVRAKHVALEALARNEDEHHFLRMKDFEGYADSIKNGNPNGWTSTQVCQWHRIIGRFHHDWRDAVLAGKWGRSRLAENDHQTGHRCLNLKAGLLVKFSCGKGVDGGEVRECPLETCEQYLARVSP